MNWRKRQRRKWEEQQALIIKGSSARIFFFFFFLLFTQNARVYGFSVEHALLNEESSDGDSTKFYDDLVTTNIHTFTIFSFFPQALNKNLIDTFFLIIHSLIISFLILRDAYISFSLLLLITRLGI